MGERGTVLGLGVEGAGEWEVGVEGGRSAGQERGEGKATMLLMIHVTMHVMRAQR